jgi:quercetin dioxygenase-like cupin family protein
LMTVDSISGIASSTSHEVDERPWELFAGMPHVQVKYLFSASNSVAGLMRLDPGAHEVPHLHVGGQHHVWVLEGAVHFDGKLLNAGSYLHVPENTTHAMQTHEEGCTLFFVYSRQE